METERVVFFQSYQLLEFFPITTRLCYIFRFNVGLGIRIWHRETIPDGGQHPSELTLLCYTVFRNILRRNKFIHISTISQD